MAGLLLEGEGIRKALLWLSERRREAPAEPRPRLIDEAGRRFDLSPVEVEFLLQNWREDGPPST
jgi:hypothetical protein